MIFHEFSWIFHDSPKVSWKIWDGSHPPPPSSVQAYESEVAEFDSLRDSEATEVAWVARGTLDGTRDPKKGYAVDDTF